MNTWLIAAAVAVAAVVLLSIITSRRSRSSADELDQHADSNRRGATSVPSRAGSPPRLQKSGSLDQPGLRSLIWTISAGRETGTLALTFGAETGALFFLFGHLFHAVGGILTGEQALQAMLGWPETNYVFERTAKLPTEESIERPLSDILPRS
ncbi:MAG: DUF4388 domain-containing protein [Candidatus Dormibacteraeota bacterium]|nr:DUF4388 domain-containing protein [Candidatus Dormibacteraeota bacterium]